MQITERSKIGFGLWKIAPDVCSDVVYSAIKMGYRHLDSACDYGNEKEVGAGIARALADGVCRREDLWVTSKLWNTYHQREHVKPALERTLSDLGLDYLDSYLIHFPIAQPYVPFDDRYPPEWVFDPQSSEPCMLTAPVPLYETWQAMEAVKEEGLARHIGVCNYNTGLLNDLMSYATIKPSELQIESHPYLTQTNLIRLAHNYGLEVSAFSPLGALSYVELNMAEASDSVLTQPLVLEIAQRLDRTPAQVVLRWGIQRGCSVITKSSNAGRMQENLQALDFELDEADMESISALNSNRRFNDPGVFCEAAFNKFYPIYD